MNLLLSTISFQTEDQLLLALLITLAVVGVLLFAAMIFATVTKIAVAITYSKYNKLKCQNTKTAQELTRENLDNNSLTNVTVGKASWLRGLLGLNMQGYGNSYSAYKKRIFLRKNIINKNSVTAYAVSTQKVAHAIFDQEKKHQFYYKVKPLLIFTPILVIPFTLVGLFLDFSSAGTLGIYTITFAVVSLILFLLSFVMLLITIPIEKQANAKAEAILQSNKQVTDEEMQGVKKVNKAYILSYISDFIYAVIQIIWDILKIALKVLSKAQAIRR